MSDIGARKTGPGAPLDPKDRLSRKAPGMNVTTKHRLYWDYEKEERWLNEMASKGLHLLRYSWGTYRFEQGTPGEWTYRIELLPQATTKPASLEYLAFMEDARVQTVSTYMNWVYFRKRTSDGPFELFSDLDSRIAHYERILALFSSLTAALTPITAASLLNLSHDARNLPFILPALAILVGGVALMGVQSVRVWRRVKALKEQKRVFE